MVGLGNQLILDERYISILLPLLDIRDQWLYDLYIGFIGLAHHGNYFISIEF